MSYTVKHTFADRDNFAKRYQPGDKLPGTFSEDRVAHLLEHGLIEADEPAARSAGVEDVKPPVQVEFKQPKAAPKPRVKK